MLKNSGIPAKSCASLRCMFEFCCHDWRGKIRANKKPPAGGLSYPSETSLRQGFPRIGDHKRQATALRDHVGVFCRGLIIARSRTPRRVHVRLDFGQLLFGARQYFSFHPLRLFRHRTKLAKVATCSVYVVAFCHVRNGAMTSNATETKNARTRIPLEVLIIFAMMSCYSILT